MTIAAGLGMVDAIIDSSVLVLPLLSPLPALPTIVTIIGLLQFLLRYLVPYLIRCHLLLFLLARAFLLHLLLLTAEPRAGPELF
jgi:hypothetical protein